MPDTTLKGDSRDLLRIVLPAAARGDLKSVKRFLRDDIGWLYRIGPHGRTMLWEAAYKNRVETVRYLIENGANVNSLGTYYTPLIVDLNPYAVARHHGHEELMELCEDCGALFDIHSAAYFGELEQVEAFLAQQPGLVNAEPNIFSGVPLRVQDAPFNKKLSNTVAKLKRDLDNAWDESTAFVHAQLQKKKLSQGKKSMLIFGRETEFGERQRAFGDLIQDVVHGRHTSRNRYAAIRELHRCWHSIRHRWADQFSHYLPPPYIHTTLHYAVQGKQLEVVKLLLARGAEVKQHSKLLLNMCLGSPEMMKLLIKHKADVKTVVSPEWVGDEYLERLAKKHGSKVDINQTDGKFTPLIEACRGNHNAPDEPRRVQPILDQGADINARDYKNKTALHRAAQAGFFKIGSLLCDSGADLEARDDEQETPIFDAVRYGRIATTMLLIDRGAEVDVTNRVGRTLLEIAKRSKKKDAAKVLTLIRSALRAR